MYACVPVKVYVHHMCACLCRGEVSMESGEEIRAPGTGFTGGCELTCGVWELNVGPLEGLGLNSESSFQVFTFLF